MIIALYIKQFGKLRFQMAVSQVMPNWADLVHRRRDELEGRGCVVREKYYTEGEWACQMPVVRGDWVADDDDDVLIGAAQAVALAWSKLAGGPRRRDMKVMKDLSPSLYRMAKTLFEIPGKPQVT